MDRELAAWIIQNLVVPILLSGIGLFFAYAKRKLDQYTDNQRLLNAVDILGKGAAAVVADIEQHTVRDLKDPNKPGAWDDVSKLAVRETAILRLKRLYPDAVRVLEQANAQKTDETLGTLVEAAVLSYKKP